MIILVSEIEIGDSILLMLFLLSFLYTAVGKVVRQLDSCNPARAPALAQNSTTEMTLPPCQNVLRQTPRRIEIRSN